MVNGQTVYASDTLPLRTPGPLCPYVKGQPAHHYPPSTLLSQDDMTIATENCPKKKKRKKKKRFDTNSFQLRKDKWPWKEWNEAKILKRKRCRNETSTNYEHRQAGHFRTCQCLGQGKVKRDEKTVAEDQGTGEARALRMRGGWSMKCTRAHKELAAEREGHHSWWCLWSDFTSLERVAIPIIKIWHICSPIYVTKPQASYTEAEKGWFTTTTRPTCHPPSLISRCPLPSGVQPGAPSFLRSSYPSPRLRCLSIPINLFCNVTNYSCWRIRLVFSSPF